MILLCDYTAPVRNESGKDENVQKVADKYFQLVLLKIISNVKDVNKSGRSKFSGKCKLIGRGVILCDKQNSVSALYITAQYVR